MNTRTKLLVLAFSGLSIVAMSSLKASARIVCDTDGNCWHVHEDYAFPPGVHVEIHPDDWHWKEGEHRSWKSTRAVVTGTAASGRDSEWGRTCEEFSVRGRKRFPAAFYGEVWSGSQECHQRTAAICAWTTALAVAVPRPAPLSP